jgi:uncharacterized membrane protein
VRAWVNWHCFASSLRLVFHGLVVIVPVLVLVLVLVVTVVWRFSSLFVREMSDCRTVMDGVRSLLEIVETA